MKNKAFSNSYSAIFIGLLSVSPYAFSQFSGNYSPSSASYVSGNSPAGGNGSINTGGAPNSITITGSNNNIGSITYFGFTAQNTGQYSFNWVYVTRDTSGPTYDRARFAYGGTTYINGTITQLTSDGGSNNQSGSSSFSLSAGAKFSFQMDSLDGQAGSADVTISNFLITLAGPSTADTQASLANTASALQNIYILQNSVLANSFSYDCTVFGVNNVCVSAGGRNTAVQAANGLNNTSGLLIAAYRPHSNYRIGAYADQNLSVNNAGSTVNLGNNTPLIGVFGAWNERLDGTGAEVKVSAAYGQKNTTINRQVIGTSEAGSGGSQLNSQGAQVITKFGFGVMPDVVVSPYAGIRYTQNNMGGYTEGTSATVTAPLTYSALNTNATTALAGLGASYKGIPQTNIFASAGVETDTNTANGSYSATGVTDLTPVNFNSNPVKTRPTAMLGAYYDIEKNQRLGITGIYRQEAYQAVSTTTVMATYSIGL